MEKNKNKHRSKEEILKKKKRVEKDRNRCGTPLVGEREKKFTGRTDSFGTESPTKETKL